MTAPPGPVYIYRAACQRVVDGDTFKAMVDLGFDTHHAIDVRLHGVNAPEHNRPGGPEARDFLRALIEGRQLLIQTFKDKQSFVRWICDAWVDGASITDSIITAGHGVPFDPAKDKWER